MSETDMSETDDLVESLDDERFVQGVSRYLACHIRRRIEMYAALRKAFVVEELPQGALAKYNRPHSLTDKAPLS